MTISQSFLNKKAMAYKDTLNERMRKSADAGIVRSAFLCHSHEDKILVMGLIAYFLEENIRLYIDWKDHSMPESPNVETAKKIQEAIKSRPSFLFLATASAKASRWCPWEIGYADSSMRKITIIPTSDSIGTYGNEYLQLYSHIDIETQDMRSRLSLFRAGITKGKCLTELLL